MENNKTKIYIADVLPLKELCRLQKYLKDVSPDRQKRAARLKSLDLKALSVGAEVLLLKAVEQFFGIRDQLKQSKDDQGKPFFPEYPNVHFNLSHSGNFVVCAVSDHLVGVDIEQANRVNLELAKRFFHTGELRWLLSLPEEEQKKASCDLWSIKESYMKYIGKGFGLPMKDFEVKIKGPFPRNMEVSIFEKEQRKKVFIKKYECPKNYVLWCSSELNHFDDAIEWINL